MKAFVMNDAFLLKPQLCPQYLANVSTIMYTVMQKKLKCSKISFEMHDVTGLEGFIFCNNVKSQFIGKLQMVSYLCFNY